MSIIFPHIDPVIVHIGPLAPTWYGMSYALGILFAEWYAKLIAAKYKFYISSQDLSGVVIWSILAIVLGGRFGYVIFYGDDRYTNNLLEVFKVYEGGMSFHGAVVGLAVVQYLYCKHKKIEFWLVSDLIAMSAPIGIMFGRIANFVNRELYGRHTDMPWGVIFSPGDEPRHPSQLYEAFFEGAVMFVILWYLSKKYYGIKHFRYGYATSMFCIIYGIFRIFCEYFREPDVQIGYLSFGITMGQILSIGMLVFGVYIIKVRNVCSRKS